MPRATMIRIRRSRKIAGRHSDVDVNVMQPFCTTLLPKLASTQNESDKRVARTALVTTPGARIRSGTMGRPSPFNGIVAALPSIAPTFMQRDIAGALNAGLLTVILTFFPVELFDASGTLIDVALCYIVMLLIRGLAEIDGDDLTEATPASSLQSSITMPFTFSIAFGFVSYSTLKIRAGRTKDLSPMVAPIAVVFVLKFAFLRCPFNSIPPS